MAGIEVKYEVLNQRTTPAFYASSLADRPTFGFPGRIFIDSDSPSTGIYRDTGSAWVQVADQGAGTTGTLQNVTTNGNTSNTGISVTANGIGIGTTIPASNRLDIHASSGIQATFNGTGVTNAAVQLQSAGVGKWNVRNNYNAGSNDFEIFDVLNGVSRLKIINNGRVDALAFVASGDITSGLSVTGQRLNILADGAGVVLQGYADNFLRLAVRGSGYNDGARAGLLCSTGDFSGAISITNPVTAGIAVASTHKVQISIGGVTYYLLASNI